MHFGRQCVLLHYSLVRLSMPLPFVDRASSALPVQLVSQLKWKSFLREQTAARRAWFESSGVSGKAGDLSVFPGRNGKAAGAVLVLPAHPGAALPGEAAYRCHQCKWRTQNNIVTQHWVYVLCM